MSTSESRTPEVGLFPKLFGLGFGLVVLVTASALLHPHNPSMAKGMLQGGVAVLLLIAVGFVMVSRGRGGAAARTMSWSADERDNRVVEKALSVGGLAALPVMSVAAVALAVGASVAPTMAVMLWVELLTIIAAYAWHARRL